MRKLTWTLAFIGASTVVVLGAGLAFSAYTSNSVDTSGTPAATDLADSKAIAPAVSASAATTTPDTVAGENQRLQTDFDIDLTAPSSVRPALDRAGAIARVRSIQPAESSQAVTITARLASLTHRSLADAGDAALAAQGVRVRPKNLDVWVVTLHHVQIHWHGPSRSVPPAGNVAIILDARTGEFVASCAYAPVR